MARAGVRLGCAPPRRAHAGLLDRAALEEYVAPMSGRGRLARGLVVAASFALVPAVVAGYTERAIVDSDQFANRATAALESDSVRAVLAQRITDDLVLERHGDLLAARPAIEAVAADVVGGQAFTGLFRRAVRDVHAALLHREQSTLTLTVVDVGTLVAAALEQLRPSLAAQVESARDVDLLTRDVGGVDAALRLRERLGFAGEGERGMYLCHSFCELGDTEPSVALDDIHDFLVANPGEVLVVINQDYVTPEDFVGAVREAGLEELAYRGPVSATWPTLREMIDRGERVLFMAENEAGAAPWYHPVYDAITQETPYAFKDVEQLIGAAGVAEGCRPNRGGQGAPLVLVNHWITTDPLPLPSMVDRVNAYEPLLQRVRECRLQRRHFPNLIAVNFYRRGDLFRVVDALNGLG
jgi:hypothetical protein